jgi:hypothetical protein
MMFHRGRWVAGVMAMLLPALAQPQGSVGGTVIDDATRAPLAGVEVLLRAGGDSSAAPVRTDNGGRFRIPLAATKTFRLEARKPGYEVLTSPALDAELAAAGPVQLVLRPARNGVAGLVRGRVVDSSGAPIGFAQVRVASSGEQVTDDSGRFDVVIRTTGRVVVAVRRIGYQPYELALAGIPDSVLRLVMAPIAGTLETVHIDADRTVASLENAGFYRRLRESTRGASTGRFVTPEEIERRRPVRATALLEGMSGVKVLLINPKQYAVFGTNNCPMTVFLDGVRLSSLASKTATPFDDFIPSTSLAGMEVYARANAPVEFQALNGTCGVVVIWSK